jgi:Tfp pilus assembly protein PilV
MKRSRNRSAKRATVASPAAQRGISLIEGLISILLVSIIGLGLAFITTRAISIQGLSASEAQVLLGLRNALVDPSLQITVGDQNLTVTRVEEDLSFTITVGGISHTVDVPAESLSVTNTSLIRGDGSLQLNY